MLIHDMLGSWQGWSARPIPLVRGTVQGADLIIRIASRSSWLSVFVLSALLALVAIMFLRLRRRLARTISRPLLLNVLSAVTLAALVIGAIMVAGVLVAPAAALEASYGGTSVPPPRTITMILAAVCLLSAVAEAAFAR